MNTLLGDEGHLWLFAQICLLKQQVKAQQTQIDHLEQALKTTVERTDEPNLCGKCSRCSGVLLKDQGHLISTDCGDVRHL